MRYEAERTAVVSTARELFERDLVAGTSGNVSLQVEDDLVAITPHGTRYETMQPTDIILVDLQGDVVEGDLQPSVETAIHLRAIAARRDVTAVVHSHPLYASMFALAHRPIPALIDEFVVECGAEIPCAGYAISGTDDLAQNVVAALGAFGRAALMVNHGLVVAHTDLDHCLALTAAIDRTAHIVLGAESLGGAVPLPAEAANLYTAVYEYKVKEAKGET
ncbi:MAG: class II aldolase/adducin family protein [Acidimicrobiia bacterium]|nr:class II aldolase/adducin family protein [Acidimicrobiia bacterium]